MEFCFAYKFPILISCVCLQHCFIRITPEALKSYAAIFYISSLHYLHHDGWLIITSHFVIVVSINRYIFTEFALGLL